VRPESWKQEGYNSSEILSRVYLRRVFLEKVCYSIYFPGMSICNNNGDCTVLSWKQEGLQ
jgi:hypothetical protein